MKKTRKRGGSMFKLSPAFVQSLVNKMQEKQPVKTRKKTMSTNSVTKRQALMKLNHNLKMRNLTKKKSKSSEYSEAEVVNTSGPNWEIEEGNFKRREKIPRVLLPNKTTKGAVFVRISSSYPKISGGKKSLTLNDMEQIVRQKNTSEIRRLLESVNAANRSPEGVSRKIEINNQIFNYLIKHPYLLFNTRFQNTVYDRINELETHRQVTLTTEEKQIIETLKDIIKNINNRRLSKDKVIQNSFELNI